MLIEFYLVIGDDDKHLYDVEMDVIPAIYSIIHRSVMTGQSIEKTKFRVVSVDLSLFVINGKPKATTVQVNLKEIP